MQGTEITFLQREVNNNFAVTDVAAGQANVCACFCMI